MDPIKNPFSPDAGSPPPELVGRDPILEQARVLLARVKQKRSEKSMMPTGLRGVGKTVLLNEIVACPPKPGPVLMGIVQLAESQGATHAKTTQTGPDRQDR